MAINVLTISFRHDDSPTTQISASVWREWGICVTNFSFPRLCVTEIEVPTGGQTDRRKWTRPTRGGGRTKTIMIPLTEMHRCTGCDMATMNMAVKRQTVSYRKRTQLTATWYGAADYELLLAWWAIVITLFSRSHSLKTTTTSLLMRRSWLITEIVNHLISLVSIESLWTAPLSLIIILIAYNGNNLKFQWKKLRGHVTVIAAVINIHACETILTKCGSTTTAYSFVKIHIW